MLSLFERPGKDSPAGVLKVKAHRACRMLDPKQLSQWFSAHAAALVLYARHWLDSQAAEDVVHDVFLKLMDQNREPQDAKAWLYAAVRNASISAARSRWRRARHEFSAGENRPSWFVESSDDTIYANEVQTILRLLPGPLREIVTLRIWAQMSFKQIAEVTNTPLSTVFDQYRGALSKIRQI